MDQENAHIHTNTHTHTKKKIKYHSAFQNKEILHLQQHGWTGGRYAKWNKLDRNREKQIIYIWNCHEGKPFIEIESRMVINRD